MDEEIKTEYPPLILTSPPYVICPKHGKHNHYIHSSITGHSGYWCMICAIEMLGPALPTVEE